MKARTNTHKCLKCNTGIDDKVFKYSEDKFHVTLCRPCQAWFEESDSTEEALTLFLHLRNRGVNATLEKFDGYKTIDIAIVGAKLNIEVDGSQHNWKARQALSDLKRTYYSFEKGYLTLRIPNSLVKYDLDETVDYILKFLECRKEQLRA